MLDQMKYQIYPYYIKKITNEKTNYSPPLTYGLFGSLKNEGEQSKERESNSIILFESFLRNKGEGF